MPKEQVDNVCEGLQVTVEFDHAVDGIFDRAVLKERIRECVEPHVRRGVMSGNHCLRDVVVRKFPPNGTEEIGRETLNLVVRWLAHVPWHIDHPDWADAPSLVDPRPFKTVAVSW